MPLRIARNFIRFAFLIALQVVVLNQINLGNNYAIPLLYILALLMLPFETPTWLLLTIAFLTGVVMDSFSNTLGMHASACTLMAFVRVHLLKMIEPREGYEYNMRPTIQHMGFNWFISYTGILTTLHHLWLFYIEVFRFSGFFNTLFRSLTSATFTLLLIILSQYLIFQPKRGPR